MADVVVTYTSRVVTGAGPLHLSCGHVPLLVLVGIDISMCFLTVVRIVLA